MTGPSLRLAGWLPHRADVAVGHASWRPDEPEQPVFIHLLSPALRDPDNRWRFCQRLWLAEAAQLPHVNPALAVVCFEQGLAVLSPLVDGMDLHQVCAQHGPLSPSAALGVAARIADTLAAAAPVGLRPAYPPHGRLEPRAVQVDTTGTLTMLEYAFHPDPDLDEESRGAFIPMTAIRSGAPEHFRENARPDDRYALGVLLLHLLRGHLLRPHDSMVDYLMATVTRSHQTELVASAVSSIETELPPGASALLRDLLAYEPADRPAPQTLPARFDQLSVQAGGPCLAEWAGRHDLSVPLSPIQGGGHLAMEVLDRPDDPRWEPTDDPPTVLPL